MMCPWGWLQLNADKTLDMMPYHEVLNEAGMAYTEAYCSSHGGQFCVSLQRKESVSCAMANLHYVVNICNDPLVLDKVAERLLAFFDLPSKAKQKFMPHLRKLFEANKEYIHYPTCDDPLVHQTDKVLALVGLEVSNQVKDIEFPGGCKDPHSYVTEAMHFVGQIARLHSTGLYLLPGDTLLIDVLEEEALVDGWHVYVGCHSDDLTGSDEWRRFPNILVQTKVNKKLTKVYTPFGGLLYLKNPEFATPKSIHLKITGAILAPQWKYDHPEGWAERRLAPAPWADIVGRNIIITLPSSSIRDLNDPEAVMKLWNQVVDAHHELRGTSAKDKHEWVVTDEQPSAGYMHCGYPVVTHLDVADPNHKHFLLNKDRLLNEGNWGMFHELGHNMQRNEWTVEGTIEVTCNIFTLHAMDVVSGVKPWIHPWIMDEMSTVIEAIQSDNPYRKWKEDARVGLMIYAQLQLAFGWDPYKTVFREYEDMEESYKPKGNQAKIDTWVEKFSETVQRNLCPLYDLWAIPVSEKTQRKLKFLAPFLPDDDITKTVPEKVQMIREKYRI